MDHPIFETLSLAQQAVVEILGDHWLQNRNWPVFDYLDRMLRARIGANGMETLALLPSVKGAHPTEYRMVFTERGGPFAEPDQRVGLTIAGLWHLPAAADVVSQLVRTIDYLAEADEKLAPDPDRVVSIDIPVDELITTHLPEYLATWDAQNLAQALALEPACWGAVRPRNGQAPRMGAGRHLALFRGVRNGDDYLARVISALGPDAHRKVAPAIRSPLDLPEALGYLDAVWQVRFRSHLLGTTRPAAAAKLALPCGSTDEFDARLSALADVIGQLTVDLPSEAEQDAMRARERSLARMRRKLRPILEPEAFRRVDAAIRALQLTVRIRVGGQHSGSGAETAVAFSELGLRYPPTDWGKAWENIRTHCGSAIDAIREELEVQ